MNKKTVVAEILACANYFDDHGMFDEADGLTNIAHRIAQIEDFSPDAEDDWGDSPIDELAGWDQGFTGISDDEDMGGFDQATPPMMEPDAYLEGQYEDQTDTDILL